MDVVQWDESKLQSMLVYPSDGGDDQNMNYFYFQCGIISVCL